MYCSRSQWQPYQPGSIFCLLLRVSSDYAQPITGQVTEVIWPVIGQAQPELTLSQRWKTGPGSIFCLLLRRSSDYAQPITGQVTVVTCPVISRAQPELTQSQRWRTGPGLLLIACEEHCLCGLTGRQSCLKNHAAGTYYKRPKNTQNATKYEIEVPSMMS